jgi:hypothetical protein
MYLLSQHDLLELQYLRDEDREPFRIVLGIWHFLC